MSDISHNVFGPISIVAYSALRQPDHVFVNVDTEESSPHGKASSETKRAARFIKQIGLQDPT